MSHFSNCSDVASIASGIDRTDPAMVTRILNQAVHLPAAPGRSVKCRDRTTLGDLRQRLVLLVIQQWHQPGGNVEDLLFERGIDIPTRRLSLNVFPTSSGRASIHQTQLYRSAPMALGFFSYGLKSVQQ